MIFNNVRTHTRMFVVCASKQAYAKSAWNVLEVA